MNSNELLFFVGILRRNDYLVLQIMFLSDIWIDEEQQKNNFQHLAKQTPSQHSRP